jgi:hypothetical protein
MSLTIELFHVQHCNLIEVMRMLYLSVILLTSNKRYMARQYTHAREERLQHHEIHIIQLAVRTLISTYHRLIVSVVYLTSISVQPVSSEVSMVHSPL